MMSPSVALSMPWTFTSIPSWPYHSFTNCADFA